MPGPPAKSAAVPRTKLLTSAISSRAAELSMTMPPCVEDPSSSIDTPSIDTPDAWITKPADGLELALAKSSSDSPVTPSRMPVATMPACAPLMSIDRSTMMPPGTRSDGSPNVPAARTMVSRSIVLDTEIASWMPFSPFSPGSTMILSTSRTKPSVASSR